MVPQKAIVLNKDFPRTKNGKVDIKKLKKL